MSEGSLEPSTGLVEARHIVVDPKFNVRQTYTGLAELGDSIVARGGLIDALTVWDRGYDVFLVHGFRRMTTIGLLQKDGRLPLNFKVPVVIRTYPNMAAAMAENIAADKEREPIKNSEMAERLFQLRAEKMYDRIDLAEFAKQMGMGLREVKRLLEVRKSLHPQIIVEWAEQPRDWEFPIDTLFEWSKMTPADQLVARAAWTPVMDKAKIREARIRRLQSLKKAREAKDYVARKHVRKIVEAFDRRIEAGHDLTVGEEASHRTLLWVLQEIPLWANAGKPFMTFTPRDVGDVRPEKSEKKSE